MKIADITFDNLGPITAADITMGGLLKHSDGNMYMVLIVGNRFVPTGEDSFDMTLDQHCAILGRHAAPGTPEEDEIYAEYYNLTLAEMDEEQMDGYMLPISEKVDKFAGNHSELPVDSPPRTKLQHLLFQFHAHYDPEGAGHIIYFEKDLEKVCDIMHEHLQEEMKKPLPETDPDTAKWAAMWMLQGMDQVFSEMKAFFAHKA